MLQAFSFQHIGYYLAVVGSKSDSHAAWCELYCSTLTLRRMTTARVSGVLRGICCHGVGGVILFVTISFRLCGILPAVRGRKEKNKWHQENFMSCKPLQIQRFQTQNTITARSRMCLCHGWKLFRISPIESWVESEEFKKRYTQLHWREVSSCCEWVTVI